MRIKIKKMATKQTSTLAAPTLPPKILAEMERLNKEAAPLQIWLRTRANAPQKTPWHFGAFEKASYLSDVGGGNVDPPPTYKPSPYLWKWKKIEPYLHRVAEIAPLEFTDRQQFLLLNPGLGGALRVSNTIRCAVSIYKPGDKAVTHMHSPNASRTILSETGGYTTVDGEKCLANRGDLILTPNGTWHGHGNDSKSPIIWMDILDWPLLELLDCIWIENEDPNISINSPPPSIDFSKRHYSAGGITPRSAPKQRGVGQKNTPMMHYEGKTIRQNLEELASEEGNPYEGIQINFTNPINGKPVFTTLGYNAQLLRPNEKTLPCRQTASALYCCISGHGYTEICGERYEWEENDIFIVPNHLWRKHVNLNEDENAILYGVTDAPLLQKIGHFRSQGRTQKGKLIELDW